MRYKHDKPKSTKKQSLTVEHFREAGFTFDRGFGEQMALPLEGWTRSRRGGSLPVQAALFEGVS